MRIAAAVLCGFFMDLCLGDPDWMPHPVIYMGKAISALEKFLRRRFPDTPKGLLMAGAALAAILPLGSFLMAAAAIYLAGLVHPVLAFLLETLWCWQALAVKGLYTESMRVKKKLEEQDLPGARSAVARIVGRDTQNLDAAGVAKAAIETVAENFSDGVAAPLFYWDFAIKRSIRWTAWSAIKMTGICTLDARQQSWTTLQTIFRRGFQLF